MSDSDKQALLDGTAAIQTKIEVVGENIILTEENSVIDWNHEDFRQVKDEGFIGQFVARQLTGNLKNLSDDFCITDKELELKMGVKVNNTTTWYSLGNFLVTKVTDDEVNDKTHFEALDYAKKFNRAYEDTITYPCTALQLAQNVCSQCGVTLGNTDFKNNDYVISGNVFTNNESCRDVMKAIGKLAFSWVRVDWDNKVYIDFDPTPFTTETTPSQYNTISNNKYYNLKTQKEVYGPVDKIVIGYSAIEGERTHIGADEGICVINVFDNPLVYTQEQRASVIQSANDLLGFTYTPLNTLTVGHPWLKGNEIVRVTDMENVSHDTIPLDRTIQYFGHIKTLIDSSTPTKMDDGLSYKPEMVKNYERSEIYNNQNDKEIGMIIETQTNTDAKVNTTISTLENTLQRVSKTETSINDIITTTQVSTGKNHLYLEDVAQGNALTYLVDGVCEQNGEPTPDSPIEIKTIPNTINKFTLGTGDISTSGVGISYNYSEVTINGITTGSCDLFQKRDEVSSAGFRLIGSFKAGRYTFSSRLKSGNVSNTNSHFVIQLKKSDNTLVLSLGQDNLEGVQTLTLSSDTKLYAQFYCNGADINFNNCVLDLQIEDGATGHDYIPYGHYAKVKITGKNIFDKNNVNTLKGWISNNDNQLIANNSTYSFYIMCNKNTDYTISRVQGDKFRIGFYYEIPRTGITLNNVVVNDTADTITVNSGNNSHMVVYYYDNGGTPSQQDILDSIQIEQGTQKTDYELYKDKDVLISLEKENLFTGKHKIKNVNINSSGTLTTDSSFNVYYEKVTEGQTYTMKMGMSNSHRQYVYNFWSDEPKAGETGTARNVVINRYVTFTVPSGYNYVAIREGAGEYANELTILDGYDPTSYYEIAAIGDDKDTLSVDSNGNCIINKIIDKIVLNGRENWSFVDNNQRFTVNQNNFPSLSNVYIRYSGSAGNQTPSLCTYLQSSTQGLTTSENNNFAFSRWSNVNYLYISAFKNSVNTLKTWLATNNLDIYYKTISPQTIVLSNTKIPLFDGVNHITFVDTLETNTNVSYYRKTPLSGTYATIAQVNEVSTDKTTEILTVKQEVMTEINKERVRIDIVREEIDETGVPILNTGTGYTFDIDGLKMEKTDQDVKSQLDNDGLSVKYKEDDVLTARSDGVNAVNMTVNKFYIQKPIRMEKTKAASDSTSIGLGFFYVGE